MKNMIHKILLNKKGFTLVELLVVISIIAVLSTIIGVNYSNSKKTARDSKRKADMENVAAAFEMYYAEYKKYPACPWSNATASLNSAGYLTTIPKDPLEDGSTWTYNCNSGDKWFATYTRLEDTKDSAITISGLTSQPSSDNINLGSGVYRGDQTDNGLFYRVVGK